LKIYFAFRKFEKYFLGLKNIFPRFAKIFLICKDFLGLQIAANIWGQFATQVFPDVRSVTPQNIGYVAVLVHTLLMFFTSLLTYDPSATIPSIARRCGVLKMAASMPTYSTKI
jgi:hypothetical protein